MYTVLFDSVHAYVSKKSDVSVPCPPLINPDNGVFNCSLGDDEVPSFRDICIATCNNGYELHTSSANHIKYCQNNGSWSNSDVAYMCRKGNV